MFICKCITDCDARGFRIIMLYATIIHTYVLCTCIPVVIPCVIHDTPNLVYYTYNMHDSNASFTRNMKFLQTCAVFSPFIKDVFLGKFNFF